MKKAIELLKKNDINCDIIVGIAPLNSNIAQEIDADYFEKNAVDA